MGRMVDAADDEFWEEPIGVDTGIPHMARVYDYLLGGRTNFAVDRRLAEHATAALPGGIEEARRNVQANRRFLRWAVRHLAGELGVRQFLDIGTGIPDDDNVHAAVRQVAPDARVVYVDHDPIVLAHAHLLLRGVPTGATAYLDVDLREPETIVHRAADTLDFTEPVAIMLLGVLHYILDDENPYGLVTHLVDAVPPGSYLVISHLASDIQPEAMAELARRHNESVPADLAAIRSHAEVSRFFEGLDLLDPGVVPLGHWCHQDAAPRGEPPAIPIYGGVAHIA
jgi:S-adenosyl methyltransferase